MTRRLPNQNFRARKRLSLEQLENRQLMAADLFGVVRGSNQWLMNLNADAAAEIDREYGLSGDQYVAGKWTGSGDFMGVVRQGPDGLLHWLLDTNGDASHDVDIPFGLPGDRPVVGDWDVDGRDNVGVVRPGADGLLHWYFDLNRDPNPEVEVRFGLSTDVPVVGDWDGDGRDNPAVVRPGADGLFHWFFDRDGDIWADDELRFGLPATDMPIAGDWDGDGRDNMGVVRPGADGLTHWLLDTNRDPWAEQDRGYGFSTDKFVVGDWLLPEIDVVGAPHNSGARLAPIDLGTVVENSPQQLTHTFRVRNLGSAWLAIPSVSVQGDFTVTKGLVNALPPGGEDTLTVRLNGASPAGVHDGVLLISNGDGNESPYVVRLRATVAAPEIDLQGIADGQATPVSIGTAYVGATSAVSIAVTNRGTADLQLGTLQATGPFTVVQGLPSSLAPGASATFRIAMDTTLAGSKSGTITLVNNDSNENPFDFPIAGDVQTAPPPEPEVDVSGIQDGQSTAISFGTVNVGAAATQNFTVRNLGTAPLTLGAVQVPVGFTLIQGLPSSLAPGASAIFQIGMNTNQAGQRSGGVSFSNNDRNENPYNFTVTGEVRAVVAPQAPEIEIVGVADGQSAAVSFGTVYSGDAAMKDFTVRNLGTAPLSLGNLSIGSGFTVVQALPTRLDPSTSATLRIMMNTATAGSRSAAVSLVNSDADENPYNFTVLGTVLPRAPEVEVSGIEDGQSESVSFGDAYVGDPVSRSFTVRNLGNDTLTLGRVNVPTGFSVAQDLPASLAPNTSATFRITMNTSQAGSYRGTVSFTNNDSNEGPFNFPINGSVSAITSNYGTVVAWTRATSSRGAILVKEVRINASETNSHRIYADFLSTSGASIRTDVAISDPGLIGNHDTPQVTALTNGNSAIAWVNNNGTQSGGVRYAVRGTTGIAIGDRDRRANLAFASHVSLASIRSVSSTSGFMITWRDMTSGQTKRREFNQSGTGITGDILVA